MDLAPKDSKEIIKEFMNRRFRCQECIQWVPRTDKKEEEDEWVWVYRWKWQTYRFFCPDGNNYWYYQGYHLTKTWKHNSHLRCCRYISHEDVPYLPHWKSEKRIYTEQMDALIRRSLNQPRIPYGRLEEEQRRHKSDKAVMEPLLPPPAYVTAALNDQLELLLRPEHKDKNEAKEDDIVVPSS